MEELSKITVGNVPTLRNVWLHNGEVIGVTEQGDLVVLARIGNSAKPEARPRPPRKRKEPQAPSPTEGNM